MKNSIVRIERIELINFKNVTNGIIEFKNNTKTSEEYNLKSEIIGLYGQNGSGKTALVNAYNFLKCILEGKSLPNDAYNFINLFSNSANLKFDFYIYTSKEQYFVSYEFTLEKTIERKVIISKEKITYSKKSDEWTNKATLIDYDVNYNEEIFRPKTKFNEVILNDKENIINLKVAQKLALEKNTSFVFNDDVKKIFSNVSKNSDYIKIVETLMYFARCNLFVIMNDYTGIINMNILMPFSFRLEQEEGIIASGDVAVRLDGITVISKSIFNIISKIVKQMNIVLKYIVPSLEVELFNYGEQHDENGKIGVKVELLSIKGDSKIPIRYESEGIKKIISILSALIAMYNNSSICMVVDELDSGIYEFLLGEILKVIENGGKGQLIFTSHNLRPLEILNKNSLYFTTTNPKNRYIRFTNVKPNNNLRSLYIRSINLGGQKEEIYKETSSLEIQRAFRLAGEKYNGI